MTRSKEQSFFRSVCALAVPVALQSMLQASFGVVDQVMIGQLGVVEVAAVGLAGKFTGIYNVVVSAVGAVSFYRLRHLPARGGGHHPVHLPAVYGEGVPPALRRTRVGGGQHGT